MPDGLPRGVRADEAIAAFERGGGVVRSGKGSHVNIKMPNGQLVTIPRHGDVKAGLLHAALKKAGMSVDEFVTQLGRTR